MYKKRICFETATSKNIYPKLREICPTDNILESAMILMSILLKHNLETNGSLKILSDGIKNTFFKPFSRERFYILFSGKYPSTIELLISNGLIEVNDTVCHITGEVHSRYINGVKSKEYRIAKEYLPHKENPIMWKTIGGYIPNKRAIRYVEYTRNRKLEYTLKDKPNLWAHIEYLKNRISIDVEGAVAMVNSLELNEHQRTSYLEPIYSIRDGILSFSLGKLKYRFYTDFNRIPSKLRQFILVDGQPFNWYFDICNSQFAFLAYYLKEKYNNPVWAQEFIQDATGGLFYDKASDELMLDRVVVKEATMSIFYDSNNKDYLDTQKTLNEKQTILKLVREYYKRTYPEVFKKLSLIKRNLKKEHKTLPGLLQGLESEFFIDYLVVKHPEIGITIHDGILLKDSDRQLFMNEFFNWFSKKYEDFPQYKVSQLNVVPKKKQVVSPVDDSNYPNEKDDTDFFCSYGCDYCPYTNICNSPPIDDVSVIIKDGGKFKVLFFDETPNECVRYVNSKGVVYYTNNNNQWHNPSGPAVIFPNGSKMWYFNGMLHREGGPAKELTSGVIEFWYKGKFLKKFCHNSDGELHSFSGPSVEYKDGTKQWYIDGVQYTEEVWKNKSNPFSD